MVKVQVFGEQVMQIWVLAGERGIDGVEVDSGDSTPFYEMSREDADTVREIAAECGADPGDVVITE